MSGLTRQQLDRIDARVNGLAIVIDANGRNQPCT
jgi:hypothetical protein